jgi:two-component sensor histidine kinase
MLVFEWHERGGPPVAMPSRHGFGSRLLERVLATQLQAEVTVTYDPSGLNFRMRLPLPKPASLFPSG